ncbi:MAG: DUF2190 family protein [Candidatus Aenigmatarchaeota archaeon]
MAFEAPFSLKYSLPAKVDLSAKQYTFLKVVAGPKVDTATASGDAVAGVLQNKPAAGHPAEIAAPPCITKIVAGAALLAGAKVIPGVGGKAVAAGAAGTPYWGILLEASSDDGDIVTMLHVIGVV